MPRLEGAGEFAHWVGHGWQEKGGGNVDQVQHRITGTDFPDEHKVVGQSRVGVRVEPGCASPSKLASIKG